MSTLATIQQVCENLKSSGIDAGCEYPGFVDITHEGKHWVFGDSNETWDGYQLDEEQQVIDYTIAVSKIPCDSEGVELIADFIRQTLRNARGLRGFVEEETGGGCKWLRRGNLAITDGECGVPNFGAPAQVVTLNQDGSWDEGAQRDFPSLEAALAYADADPGLVAELGQALQELLQFVPVQAVGVGPDMKPTDCPSNRAIARARAAIARANS